MCKHAACASKSFDTIFSLIYFTSENKILFMFKSLIFFIFEEKRSSRDMHTPPSRINWNNIYVWKACSTLQFYDPRELIEGGGWINEQVTVTV